MAQERFWIVKWMPHGDDIHNGCRMLRGDNNKAYDDYDTAVERAMYVASDARREVGVFELVSVYRPPLNVEEVPVVGKQKARATRKRKK